MLDHPVHDPAEALRTLAPFMAAGFRPVLLRGRTKRPAHKGWRERHYSDEEIQRHVAAGGNVGIAIQDGQVVLDADPRNYRNGVDSLAKFAADFGLDLGSVPTTLSGRGDGGRHLYFRIPKGLRISGKLLAKRYPGIDVIGVGKQVLAPGSVHPVTGGVYQSDDLAAPITSVPMVPTSLLNLIHEPAPPEEPEREPAHGYDNPADVEEARALLADPDTWPATSDGGVSIFRVACKLYDLGISPELSVELIAEHLPVVPSEAGADLDGYIRGKVENAHRYASGEAGERSQAAAADDFAAVPLDPEHLPAEEPETDWDQWFADNWVTIGQRDLTTLPKTPWLMEGLLLYNDLTIIGGKGGVGKSLHAWQIGAAVAMGLPFAWWPAPERPRRVLVVSGEDDAPEIERRVAVACKAMGINRAELGSGGNFLVWDHRNVRLARKDAKTGKVTRTELWKGIRWAIEYQDIGLVIIDPLIKASVGFEESSNDDMEELFNLIRELTIGRACAVLLDDHFAKGGVGGDQAAVRGASAKIDAARVAITLTPMTEAEFRKMRPPRPRESYVMSSGAKQNYARKTGGRWFELVEYAVGNGETRPALVWRSANELEGFADPQTWEHRADFIRLVAKGCDDEGNPWFSTTRGEKSKRLDAALSELLSITQEDARRWIEAFKAEESIVEVDWKDQNRKSRKVWTLNPDYSTEEDDAIMALRQ